VAIQPRQLLLFYIEHPHSERSVLEPDNNVKYITVQALAIHRQAAGLQVHVLVDIEADLSDSLARAQVPSSKAPVRVNGHGQTLGNLDESFATIGGGLGLGIRHIDLLDGASATGPVVPQLVLLLPIDAIGKIDGGFARVDKSSSPAKASVSPDGYVPRVMKAGCSGGSAGPEAGNAMGSGKDEAAVEMRPPQLGIGGDAVEAPRDGGDGQESLLVHE
jgi:hypothetical protein